MYVDEILDLTSLTKHAVSSTSTWATLPFFFLNRVDKARKGEAVDKGRESKGRKQNRERVRGIKQREYKQGRPSFVKTSED